MLRHVTKLTMIALLALAFTAPAAMSQQQSISRVERDDDTYDYGYQYGDQARIDRYLGVEIWPNHHDGEYYEGDRIVLNYRTNRDAFVAIYSIDSRGRVNLLFPASPGENNLVQGGVTHHLPSGNDDYDLVVSGPEGVENIQIVASREPFPIPDWYPVSGVVLEGDDRMAFMDYLNERYFVRYGGQRFAYDRTAIYINEWEEYYFRPVYYPTYHPWTLAGNVYVDYPFGSNVYINGVFWGVTPLYLPRVYVGWHTITIVDRWGYFWESDFHVSRYHTLVLDHHVIRPVPHVKSKYREVVVAGYRDPVKAGYANYHEKVKRIETAKPVRTEKVTIQRPSGDRAVEKVVIAPKKHVRGTSKLVKTERGIETAGLVPNNDNSRFDRSSKGTAIGSDQRGYKPATGYTGPGSGFNKRDVTVGKSGRDGGKSPGKVVSPERGRSSSDYYQRKSGSDAGRNYKAEPQRRQTEVKRQKSPSHSQPSVKPTPSGGSKDKGSVSSPPPSKPSSSGSSGKSSGGSSKGGSRSKGKGGR